MRVWACEKWYGVSVKYSTAIAHRVARLQMYTASRRSDDPESKGDTDNALGPLRSMYRCQCASCNTSDATLKCSRCRSAAYCDRVCQKAHWRTHKDQCLMLRAARCDMEREVGGVVVSTRQGRTRVKTLNLLPCPSMHPDEVNTVCVWRCTPKARPLWGTIRKVPKGQALVQLGYHCNTLEGHFRMFFAWNCPCGQTPCHRPQFPNSKNLGMVLSMRFLRALDSDPVTCVATLPRGWSVHREECGCSSYETGGTNLTLDGCLDLTSGWLCGDEPRPFIGP
jgi:hypothetical protein